jgi:hypothetical protein
MLNEYREFADAHECDEALDRDEASGYTVTDPWVSPATGRYTYVRSI